MFCYCLCTVNCSANMCGGRSDLVLLESGSTACSNQRNSSSIRGWRNYLAFQLSQALGMTNVPVSTRRRNETGTILTQWITDSKPAQMPAVLSRAMLSQTIILSVTQDIDLKTWVQLARWSDVCIIHFLNSEVFF